MRMPGTRPPDGEFNPNAEIKSQEQTEETEQEALARTHAGTFCSTKDTHGMSSDSVLSVPSGKSYFGVRVEREKPKLSAKNGSSLFSVE